MKSPFYVVQNFFSPMLCEDMIDSLGVTTPDIDKDGNYIPSIRHNKKYEQVLVDTVKPLIPMLEEYYDFEYYGLERPAFEWFTEGTDDHWKCSSSEYLRKKWVRVRQRDFTGVVFLTDHQETVPFDPYFEVRGGKMQFAQHEFGFQPERGTLVIFPAGPHFLHKTALVEAGELFQMKFHIAAAEPYMYDPSQFPGDYTQWFAHLL